MGAHMVVTAALAVGSLIAAVACSAADGGDGAGGAGAAGGNGAGGSTSQGGMAAAGGAMSGGAGGEEVLPEDACDLPLEPNTAMCEVQVGPNPPVVGGDVQEGIYDRIEVWTPFDGGDPMCPRSELLLQGGIYKLQFHDIGGPYIVGGAYEIDAGAMSIHLERSCGDSPGGDYFYSWDPGTQRLTLFVGAPNPTTPWVYVRRP